MLTKDDFRKFEQQLLDLQESVLGVAELVDQSSSTVELDQTRVGRLSRMDAMQGQAMAVASSERQRETLQLITAALQRIDEGGYGLCLQCDEEIALARLHIDPTLMLCVRCASQLES